MKSIFNNWKKVAFAPNVRALVVDYYFRFFRNSICTIPRMRIFQDLKNELPQATVFYDLNGEVASKVSANKNEGVSIKQVPDSMKNAIIAIEDHRFYQHHRCRFYWNIKGTYS